MFLWGGLVGRYRRCGALGLAVLVAASMMAGDADARSRRHHVKRAAYVPDYSSIVVDVNSGAVMQATKADASRHPASLTKIMTLYLLFERLEAGKIKLNTELEVSAHAAAQAPSKLGLKPGDTIKVETAIRAIVTKSANDVAVIVGEALGGDEPSFARMMTAKAHALGDGAHHLSQCLRPARRRPGHHGARSGAARPRHQRPLPELLPLLLDAHVRISRPHHAQPQSSARHGSKASTASRPVTSTI